jgi:hypothetical protein
MRIESCLSPGGFVLNGSVAWRAGPAAWFRLASRMVPDEDGWRTWVSPDSRAAVRYSGGYSAQVLALPE